ncbi:MAG: HU family DNA-binding protein [Syntrophorhabdaceae bacterium]|nr:HU family DNA-binding protein [Syntrophorhabdaceae bacterium]
MTKSEIVEAVAKELNVTKSLAGKAFDAFVDTIKGALQKGEKVSIIGFGTFSVVDKKARKGRNPQTGKEIKIPAKKAPKFTAGKILKDAVNVKPAGKGKKK